MLVGIKFTECFITTSPPFNTTCRGCKRWKSQFLDYSNAITFRKQAKKYSQEANGLISCLYLANGSDAMFTSNKWNPVGLYNGTRGEIIDFST